MLVHNPFARLAQVLTFVPAPSRPQTILPPRPGAVVIPVPFVRLGLRTRTAAKRSTSRDIAAIHAEETRRGSRRSVL